MAKARKPKQRKYPRGKFVASGPGQVEFGLIPRDAHPSMLVRATPLFSLKSTWRPVPVNELPQWKHFKRVSVDVETDDPYLTTLGCGVRRGGRMIGISFAMPEGPGYYLPFWHVEDNLPEEHVLAYMREQSATFDGEIVGANLQYDLDYLAEAGVNFPKVKRFLDIQVAEPLLDDLQDSYSLDNIAKRHGFEGKLELLLQAAGEVYNADAKKEMKMLPARYVGEYAIEDCRLPLKILEKQLPRISHENLNTVFDMETRLTPALLAMRRRGVRVDFARLDEFEAWALKKKKDLLGQINSMSERKLSLSDLTKSEAMGEFLQSNGIEVPVTAKEKFSVTTAFLKGLKTPIGKLLASAKKYDKIGVSFVEIVRKHAVKDRIHATFNQIIHNNEGQEEDEGVRFGRLSCTDPNLQQQPSKDLDYKDKKAAGTLLPDDRHIGKAWRSIYVPEPDMLWASADYSGQEPRWATHFGEVAGLPGAKEIADKYRSNPKLDLHGELASSAAIHREQAKIIFLGLIYSMGDPKLCADLKLPTIQINPWDKKYDEKRLEWKRQFAIKIGKPVFAAGPEGSAIINKFDEMVPFVRALSRLAKKVANERGYIMTVLGRRCRFGKMPEWKLTDNKAKGLWVDNFEDIGASLNRAVQGSAADQTKMGVVVAHEAGIPLQLQVHDEITQSVHTREEANVLADIMGHCMDKYLKIPAQIDVEVGASWGESMG